MVDDRFKDRIKTKSISPDAHPPDRVKAVMVKDFYSAVRDEVEYVRYDVHEKEIRQARIEERDACIEDMHKALHLRPYHWQIVRRIKEAIMQRWEQTNGQN